MREGGANDEAARADRAFNRVLAMEESVRTRIEACRDAAAAVIKEAEERARCVHERAETRLLRAHRLADASVERALDSLRLSEPTALDEEPGAAALARLEQAIETLADDLIALGPRTSEPDLRGREP